MLNVVASASIMGALFVVILLLLPIPVLYYCYHRRKHQGSLTIHPTERGLAASLTTNIYEVTETPLSVINMEHEEGSTDPLYDTIPGDSSISPQSNQRETDHSSHNTRLPSQHDTNQGNNIVSAGESLPILDRQAQNSREGHATAERMCRRKPALRMYDTVMRKHVDTSSSDEINEATYSSLKFNFNTQHHASACAGPQKERNASTTEDTATEPDEAQYSSLKYPVKVSFYPADQYDIIASNNPESTSDPVPTYSTLETKSTVQHPSQGSVQPQDDQPQGFEDLTEQIDGAYDVIKSENIGKTEPVYSVVNKAKKNVNYSMITAEDLTASLPSEPDPTKKEATKKESLPNDEEPPRHIDGE